MRFAVVVLLFCMLIHEVLSLTCQKCFSTINKPCASTPVNCSHMCASTTVYSSVLNVTAVITIQNCSLPFMCINGSVNLGSSSIAVNSQCCNSNFCNNQTLPAPPPQLPNGMSCYTCINNNCSGTVKCVGDQNYCISSDTVVQGSKFLTSGCTTKSFCDASGMLGAQTAGLGSVKCCQANLCNGAESFTLSFFFMIILLLCFIILY